MVTLAPVLDHKDSKVMISISPPTNVLSASGAKAAIHFYSPASAPFKVVPPVAPQAPRLEPEDVVEITGTRTQAERDAELRKRAVDVDAHGPPAVQRAKTSTTPSDPFSSLPRGDKSPDSRAVRKAKKRAAPAAKIPKKAAPARPLAEARARDADCESQEAVLGLLDTLEEIDGAKKRRVREEEQFAAANAAIADMTPNFSIPAPPNESSESRAMRVSFEDAVRDMQQVKAATAAVADMTPNFSIPAPPNESSESRARREALERLVRKEQQKKAAAADDDA
jgi:hypothetical protein